MHKCGHPRASSKVTGKTSTSCEDMRSNASYGHCGTDAKYFTLNANHFNDGWIKRIRKYFWRSQ